MTAFFATRAAKVTDVSDTLSRARVFSYSNHDLSFVTPSGAPEGTTITLSFPAGFNASGLTEDDVDISSDGIALSSAIDCLSGAETGASWAANTLTFLICPGGGGGIAPGRLVRVRVGTNAVDSGIGMNRMINPVSAGPYRIAIAGTFGDSGVAVVSISDDDSIGVTACIGDDCAVRRSRPAGWSVPPNVPPTISDLGLSRVSSSSAMVVWKTDQDANSYVLYGTSPQLLDHAVGNDTLVASRSSYLYALEPDTEYYYRARSVNITGDVALSPIYVLKTLPDGKTGLRITDIRLVESSASSAQISWSTNLPTFWQIEYGTDAYYGSVVQDSAYATEHLATIGGLEPATLYHYRIFGRSADGQEVMSPDYSFTTYDTAAPVISMLHAENIGLHSFEAVWHTDELAKGGVEYSALGAIGAKNVEERAYALEHRITLIGLEAGTVYRVRSYAHDHNANIASAEITVRTIPLQAPTAAREFRAIGADGEIFLSWTPPDDPNAVSVIVARSVSGYPTEPQAGTVVYEGAASSFVDSGLKKGTTYYYSLWFRNEAGALSSAALAAARTKALNLTEPILPPETPKAGEAVSAQLLMFWVRGVPATIKADTLAVTSNDTIKVALKQALHTGGIMNAVLHAGWQSYALREDDKGFYSATFAVPSDPGEYPMQIDVLYKDGTLASSKWTIRSAAFNVGPEVAAENGEPIPGALVTLHNADGTRWEGEKYGQINPIVTDETGDYSFYVPGGNYYLKIEKHGFEPKIGDIDFFEGLIERQVILSKEAKTQPIAATHKNKMASLIDYLAFGVVMSSLCFGLILLILRLKQRNNTK